MTPFISTFFSSEAASAAIFWALIGGCVVILGLVIEEAADWMNKRFAVPHEEPHENLRFAGWCILMIGICIETADAGWSSNEMRKTELNIAKIDPVNLPILNMNAFVKLRVKGKDFPDLTQWDSIPLSTNWGSKRTTAMLCGKDPQSVLSSSIPSMIADDFGIGTGFPDSREYFINFHMEGVSAAMNLPMQPAAKSFSAANFISMDVRFLPPQSEVIDGYAFVVVNNSLWKLFNIYPQKSAQPPFPNKEQAQLLSKIHFSPMEELVVSSRRHATSLMRVARVRSNS